MKPCAELVREIRRGLEKQSDRLGRPGLLSPDGAVPAPQPVPAFPSTSGRPADVPPGPPGR